MKIFTFVTDCAATMPKIVGASVSTNVAHLSEKWIGYISHTLNTLMKHVITYLSLNENEMGKSVFPI